MPLFLHNFASETKSRASQMPARTRKIMYNIKNSTDMKKTILGMLIGIMTIIGTTASFGATDGKHHHNNHCQCRQTTTCKYHKHNHHDKHCCCPSTYSTYCPKGSKHHHKFYKNSNVCKYCKQHVCPRQHAPAHGHRREFKR